MISSIFKEFLFKFGGVIVIFSTNFFELHSKKVFQPLQPIAKNHLLYGNFKDSRD
jgi:hypothetical protein